MNPRRSSRDLPRPHGLCLPAKSSAWTRVELAAAIALSLWILVLHGLFLFHAGPLWRDEAGTIAFASMPTLSDLWHQSAVRQLPAALCRRGAVVDAGRIVRRFQLSRSRFSHRLGHARRLLAGRAALRSGAPLLALALYAANPLAVRMGDSMRPYGLGFALNLLALTLNWRFVESPRARSWFRAALAAVLSVQCLYQNICFIAAYCGAGCLVALARRQWKSAAQIAAIVAVSALSLLPHLGNILKARDWETDCPASGSSGRTLGGAGCGR